MSEWIDPRQLAVVVQGAMGPLTNRAIASIRLHLPGARIVLSTWDGTECAGLDVDDVVLSPDPGAIEAVGGKGLPAAPINTNRMIRSTLAGLQRAERRFTVKMRTDSYLDHSGVLRLLAERPQACGEWRLFDRTVIASSVYTRDPYKSPTGCFHPADTVQAGSTTDLLTLWDVPFMPDEGGDFFDDEDDRPVWSVTSARFYPEQWVFLNALRKRYVVEYDNRSVFSAEVFQASIRSLVQNFVVAEPWQLGIRVPHLEQQLRWNEDPVCVMTHPIWFEYRRQALARRADRPWSTTGEGTSPRPRTPSFTRAHHIDTTTATTSPGGRRP